MKLADLPTPALVVDARSIEANLATMAEALPGSRCRPHVKAHKCTALAAHQAAHGHRAFTCATPREAIGMAAAGLGDDLLIANEVLDPHRLCALRHLSERARVTVVVDSEATVRAAAKARLREVLIDVNIGLPRCGCTPEEAGRIADLARAAGLEVRGVMGYEGHLMMTTDRAEQAARVEEAAAQLRLAHDLVGGDVVSGGGTGTFDLHGATGLTEVQAGSYALMDTHYQQLGLPFQTALHLWTTVLSVSDRYAVCDGGLKSLGMDHGNPTIDRANVWFCSDEHITFSGRKVKVGDKVAVTPAHVDPTVALHEHLHVVEAALPDAFVLETWRVDLRGW